MTALESRTLRLTDPPMAGEDCLILQMKLGMKGYTIKANACFDESTEVIVKQFQRQNGLAATGQCDEAMRDLLGL